MSINRYFTALRKLGIAPTEAYKYARIVSNSKKPEVAFDTILAVAVPRYKAAYKRNPGKRRKARRK
jgi:hypothetical protein